MDKRPSPPGYNNGQSNNMDKRRSTSLDEAMEQIFHPTSHRYSFADLESNRQDNQLRVTCIEESDYKSHRRESLHHHQPLHKIYHRHKRPTHKEVDESEASASKSEDTEQSTIQEASKAPLCLPEQVEEEPAKIATMKDDQDEKVTFYVGSSTSIETSAVPSPRKTIANKLSSSFYNMKSALRRSGGRGKDYSVTSPMSPSVTMPCTSGIPEDGMAITAMDTGQQSASFTAVVPLHENSFTEKHKVKFSLAEEDSSGKENNNVEDKAITEQPKPKTHHKHTKRHEVVDRLHPGSKVEVKVQKKVLEPEPSGLTSVDMDIVHSHRFEDPRVIRRHKMGDKNSVRRDKPDCNGTSAEPKKVIDHQPHEIFVELNELLSDDNTTQIEWKETARWIKYEEDVEVGAERWGKPHVSSLSFHSLIKLRICLSYGTVLLDMEGRSFPNIVEQIVDGMLKSKQIEPHQRPSVISSLLLRHRHANEKKTPSVMRRSSAAHSSLTALGSEKRSSVFFGTTKIRTAIDMNNEKSHETDVLLTIENAAKDAEIIPIRHSVSCEDTGRLDTGILRRIPEKAEGTTVLVGSLNFLTRPAIAFVRLAEGQFIPNLLEVPIPTRFLFVLLGPDKFNKPLNMEREMMWYDDLDYHEIGRSISTLMSNPMFHVKAYEATAAGDLLKAINEFLGDSVVLPPSDFENAALLSPGEIRRKSIMFRKKDIRPLIEGKDDPLKRTGSCFGGFCREISYRYPLYLSDLKDGINSQCLAAMIFIFFASLSGTIAFGGILDEKTDHLIGVSETLITTSCCGILFSLFSCQPLLIIGATGPLLMLDEIFFQVCSNYGFDFLKFRFWTAVWTAIIGTVLVGLEGSSLVKFFSRFMQEIYATIIAMLFIAESVTKIAFIFRDHPLQASYDEETFFNSSFNNGTGTIVGKLPKPNIALLSVILAFCTFYIALSLRHFRNSKFLGRNARRALGDFGVPIAIATMVGIDYMFKDVETQKLNVPEGLSPSDPGARGWFILPWPIGVIDFFAAAMGGVLLFILLFLETQICELIASKRERKLKKGTGFHVDMLLTSFMTIICALIGGPWVCSATIRSISHLSSLTVWSRTHAPGEAPHIVEVKEQRLTSFCVSLLIGASVLMSSVLRIVPVTVLFGVFFYMGVSAFTGIQLCERFTLFFKVTKHHPDVPYVRRVPTRKMHFFTIVQLICIAILWAVKSVKFLAPGFPFCLLGLIFVHAQLKRFFTPQEFGALDGEEEEEELICRENQDPDFYEQIVA